MLTTARFLSEDGELEAIRVCVREILTVSLKVFSGAFLTASKTSISRSEVTGR
jgi:hypothetical protein